jgi:DNA-binding transcriptional regulator YbjK
MSRLPGSGARRKTSVEWSAEVDARLRALVRVGEEATGSVTSAGEVLSALVCDTPLSGDRIRQMLTRFRRDGTARALKGIHGGIEATTPRLGRPRHSGSGRGGGSSGE